MIYTEICFSCSAVLELLQQNEISCRLLYWFNRQGEKEEKMVTGLFQTSRNNSTVFMAITIACLTDQQKTF